MKTALTFGVGEARLGLEVSGVHEVVPMAELVTTPEMPPLLRGFLNLEGELVPVIRLENLLHLDFSNRRWAPESDVTAKILVARTEQGHVAWMTDPGLSLVSYHDGDTARLPASHVLNECAQRIIPRPPPEPSIVLLETDRLLLQKEKTILRQLTEREQSRLETAEPLKPAIV